MSSPFCFLLRLLMEGWSVPCCAPTQETRDTQSNDRGLKWIEYEPLSARCWNTEKVMEEYVVRWYRCVCRARYDECGLKTKQEVNEGEQRITLITLNRIPDRLINKERTLAFRALFNRWTCSSIEDDLILSFTEVIHFLFELPYNGTCFSFRRSRPCSSAEQFPFSIASLGRTGGYRLTITVWALKGL